MRQGFLLAVALGLLAACGGGSTRDAAQEQQEIVQRQKNCADPAWKEAHLGVWYAVCRPNAAIR